MHHGITLSRVARTLSTACIAVLAATALTGCARQGALPTQPPTTPLVTPAASDTPLPTVTLPAALQGTWKSMVRGTTASSGEWQLQVTATDMLLQNPGGGDAFSIGPIAVTDSTLTLRADSGCPDQQTVTEGHYTYAISAGVLKFTAISDSCGDRKGVLTASDWQH